MNFGSILAAATLLFCSSCVAAPAAPKRPTGGVDLQAKAQLLDKYSKTYAKKDELVNLRKETLAMGGKAVPGLIEVMKSGKFPDKNRWMATFLLGQIMGEKSAPFISKFVMHPHWVMRMAGLKTLLALKQRDYAPLYAGALQDESFIVRLQALENIQKMNITKQAPHVWAMLYDKRNYYQSKRSGPKRANIIKSVIRTVGDLKFDKAKEPLLKMTQKDKYNDIFEDMDYALAKITGKESPKGNRNVKRNFWQRQLMSTATL